jgi:hypothetical protein
MGARETENLDCRTSHATGAFIHLDHLTHNMRLLQELVGKRSLWPAIKANAYGHGADIVGRHLVRLGYNCLCVAHVAEAINLIEAGVRATFLVLAASSLKTVNLVWRTTVSQSSARWKWSRHWHTLPPGPASGLLCTSRWIPVWGVSVFGLMKCRLFLPDVVISPRLWCGGS